MTQQQWLDEILEWVGTPFRWQGRFKGDGADCWGMVVKACHATGYIPESWDVKDYTRRTDLTGLQNLHFPRWFDAVDVSRETVQAGDIVTFHHGTGILHMGVLYNHEHEGLGIVHSEDWRQIVKHRLSADLQRQIAQAWRPRYE